MTWLDGIKAEELNEPFGPPDFAASRSNLDAQISNENARAAAQTSVLINGGAATAVLAFLSKDKIDPYFLVTLPYALSGYAVGVVLGASMMMCTTKSLRFWALSWREYMVYKKANSTLGTEYNSTAKRWDVRAMACFFAAIVAFIVASLMMAWFVLHAPHTLIAPTAPGPG